VNGWIIALYKFELLRVTVGEGSPYGFNAMPPFLYKTEKKIRQRINNVLNSR
jgi:hypothetical protein